MSRKNRFLFLALTAVLTLAGALPACRPAPAPTPLTAIATSEYMHEAGEIILATTTSTENSGLLQFILPDFERKFSAKVRVVAVGTGQAMKLGEDGNADVLLVHDRAKEDAFMNAGFGINRKDVMYNDFVIVGPKSDPAGIRGDKDAAVAMAKIAGAKVPFISRGDDSGTHSKEKELWAKAGIQPAGPWYISVGQGMGQVLNITAEKQGYTLADRATYLSMTKKKLDLIILFEGDKILFNPYGVIAVNPERHPHVPIDLATKFIDWITSIATQQLIKSFGVADFGEPLFFPDSEQWRAVYGAAGETAGAAK